MNKVDFSARKKQGRKAAAGTSGVGRVRAQRSVYEKRKMEEQIEEGEGEKEPNKQEMVLGARVQGMGVGGRRKDELVPQGRCVTG